MKSTDLREQLQRIYDERGRLTPDDVLEEASNPKSELHSQFEWNDTLAAHAHRRLQAAKLIRSVKVEYVNRKGSVSQTRAFIAIRVPEANTKTRTQAPAEDVEDEDDAVLNGGYRYVPIETVTRDEAMAQQARTRMEREWRTLRRKYHDYIEFWQLVQNELEDRENQAA